jgi:hypothetical protein
MNVATIVASLEAAVGLDGPPRDLQLAIEAVLIERHGLPAIQAAERADRLREKVAVSISQREAAISEAGGSPTLRVIGATGGLVTGFCYALPDEPPEITALRVRRAHAQAIFDRIRQLTFQEFEQFGARFLRELGARIGRVTAHSNDQGIDFYGEFSLGQLHAAPEPFLVLARDVRLLFAGQAKHYPDRSIGPAVIRELIGALTLARTKTHSADGVDIFKELAVRPFSPVLALIFTTGEFTSGAIRLAEAAGVIAKTGLQLAVFLADRGVGLIEQGGTHIFSEEAFTGWLNSPDVDPAA